MNPGAVLFPTMYDMLIAMLESWKFGCFNVDWLSVRREGGGESDYKVGTYALISNNQ